ncbi:calcium-translocating P-type ATPase, PMCA-type [Methyloglobulus morosus KoM1]|uniref:Calcium-translocating P-type ATPase, PMCA-type n=1 Tax=Methyloglobulus morosus KoM1 TaxID=1116472 RepID=V5BWN8_9GAMM|nr:AI-2E family transporter [Methyloglobulus morosus]ESS72274.1 calcium-translocating P-type ATPase, PMCA-type [Methyloglobulus morosus KoM1]
MTDFLSSPPFKYAVPVALLGCLFWLGFAVLRNFFLIIIWALIIAYIMWPAYRWLKAQLHNRATLSAAVMTGFISALIVLTVFWLVNLLQGEVESVYRSLLTIFTHPPKNIPDNISQIPWLGNYLQQYLDQLNADEAGVRGQLLDWAKQWLGELIRFLRGIGRNIINVGFVLVTLFFCFRDGQQAGLQLRRGFGYFLGQYQAIYLQAAGNTTRAVVYGLVLAALGQGLIAGIGYSVAGANAPVLLGAMTALLAMMPMGAVLVWLPVSIAIMLLGEFWHGIGLLLWGIFAISTIDNVIRPLVISGAGDIPFLVGVFGVFGGLSAFGVVGLFLGPIILSLVLSVWQVWISQLTTPENPP